MIFPSLDSWVGKGVTIFLFIFLFIFKIEKIKAF